MSPSTADEVSTGPPESGDHERHLAISTAALQGSQVVAMLSMLGAVTVLARRLTLTEFGAYGLLVSLTSYVLFVQASIETAAIKAISEAADQPARDRAFSIALSLYVIAGLVAGALIAGLGTALLGVLHIPAGLHHQAQLSVLALAAMTCVGWPLKIFQDVLRATQRFVDSAVAESFSFVLVGGLMVGLALERAPLWALVAAGASIALTIGAASACVVFFRRLGRHYSRDGVTLRSIAEFAGLSGYLLVVGLADLVVYSLDRVILAAFRPLATVGLYEGPIRAHNLLRQVHGSLLIPVLPTSARYLAEGDAQRTRDLLLRGTRYTLAVIVPPTIVFMVLAEPILRVWLGPKFAAAGTSMTILVSYWLVNANTGVAWVMLVAAGRIRRLTLYVIAVALLNLGFSLALTPSLGINGVVLGTTLSYLVIFPFLFALTLATFPVSVADFAREVWLPAYLTGGLLAGGLLAERAFVPLENVPAVLGSGVVGLVAYWAIYYVVWLRPNERKLLSGIVQAILRRSA